MKIIFFGTPNFAVPSLIALNTNENIEIKAVITQPDKKVGRKQTLTPSAIKTTANELKIPVYQPNNKKELSEILSDFSDIDFFVVIAFGMILNQDVLDIPEYGCINVHGSLLPKYRGASPIQESIKNGDKQTGISIMEMDKEMDHGPVYLLQRADILANDTSEDIINKLSFLSGHLLPSVLQDIYDGHLKAIEQKHELATYCKKIEKDDGEIDFNKSAEETINTLRAYTPWPGIFTNIKDKKLKILEAEISNTEIKQGKFEIIEKELYLGFAKQSLKIKKVQIEGKNEMDANSFINGYKSIFIDNK